MDEYSDTILDRPSIIISESAIKLLSQMKVKMNPLMLSLQLQKKKKQIKN